LDPPLLINLIGMPLHVDEQKIYLISVHFMGARSSLKLNAWNDNLEDFEQSFQVLLLLLKQTLPEGFPSS